MPNKQSNNPVTLESLAQQITQQGHHLESRIDEQGQSLEAKIDQQVERLDTKITQQVERLDTKITQQVERLESRIDEQGKRLEAKITQQVERLESRMDEQSERLETKIDEQGNHLGSRIDQQGKTLVELSEQNDYIIKYLTGGGLIEDMKRHFATKEEFIAHEAKSDDRYTNIMNVLDAHTKMMTKLDQERLMQIHRIDRLEAKTA